MSRTSKSLEQDPSHGGTKSAQAQPRRKLGLLDFFLNADWEEIRQHGRRAYVRSRVVGLGIPLGFGLAVWHVLHLGYSASALLSGTTLGILGGYVGVALAVMFVAGRAEWETREKKYREERDGQRRARG